MFYEKAVLKISQNSQENTCARVSFLFFFIKLHVEACNLIEKEILEQVFRVNFAKRFLQNTSGSLRLSTEMAFTDFIYPKLNALDLCVD